MTFVPLEFCSALSWRAGRLFFEGLIAFWSCALARVSLAQADACAASQLDRLLRSRALNWQQVVAREDRCSRRPARLFVRSEALHKQLSAAAGFLRTGIRHHCRPKLWLEDCCRNRTPTWKGREQVDFSP